MPMSTTQPALREVPLLTPDESEGVRQTVHSLKAHFRRRGPFPFFTLGTPSYIDNALGPAGLLQRVAQDNPLMAKHFQGFYDRVLGALREVTGEKVSLDPAFAFPGFHIFLSDEAFKQPLASVHFDHQFLHYDWSPHYRQVDLSKLLSFTLPVRLPASGGGLRIWDLTHEEAQKLPKQEYDAIRHGSDFKYQPYTVGRLVIHSGHHLHQIAPATDIQEDDERITLQGHALYTEKGWVAYW
jgi:hypothetical protein